PAGGGNTNRVPSYWSIPPPHRNPEVVVSKVRSPVCHVVVVVAVSLTGAQCGDTAAPVTTNVNDYVATLPSWESFAPPLADADTVLERGVDESTETIGATTYTCTT